MADSNQPNSNTSKKPRVLFICIGNSCRSPMAESIARKDACDVFDCASAGLSPLGVVQRETLATLTRNGYGTEELTSDAILEREWDAADVVVNMSGFAKEKVFPRSEWAKVEDWAVEDPYGENPATYQRIFEDIRTRMNALTKRLRAQ
jgi:protein-tyrosine-phosphatase